LSEATAATGQAAEIPGADVHDRKTFKEQMAAAALHGWECRNGKPNHAWDVSVYNLVAATVLLIARKAAANKSRPRRRVINGGVKVHG
jgi:hypothetical protein